MWTVTYIQFEYMFETNCSPSNAKKCKLLASFKIKSQPDQCNIFLKWLNKLKNPNPLNPSKGWLRSPREPRSGYRKHITPL